MVDDFICPMMEQIVDPFIAPFNSKVHYSSSGYCSSNSAGE